MGLGEHTYAGCTGPGSTTKQPRLVLVEGIPGAGKTTTAQFVHRLLAERGQQARLYLEGDIDHPADFEAAACLNELEYRRLLSRFPDWAGGIQTNARCTTAGYVIVSYGSLCRFAAGGPSAELLAYLRRHDAVDGTDVSLYRRITLDRWRAFGATAAAADGGYVFECCFLQNPTTVLLCRHNASAATIESHIHAVADAVRALAPSLIYLRQADVHGTLARVRAERPQAWFNFVADYVTGQGWAKERGLTGFDGVVEFYKARQELELDVLNRLAITHRVLDPGIIGWEATRAAIKALLDA